MILERLSPRQKDCLRLVFARRTSKEIAAELGIGVGTVDSYIAEAVALLGAPNRRRAAEILFGNAQPPPPEILEPVTPGVASITPSSSSPETLPQPRRWLGVLPFRTTGVEPNDLKPSHRLFWILQITFGLAISFGMLATGLGVISHLLGVT